MCHMSCGHRICHMECKLENDATNPFKFLIMDYEQGKRFTPQMINPLGASLWGKCHDNKCRSCSKVKPCISSKFTISWWSCSKSGDWVYYAYVYDGGIIRYYRNGIQVINGKYINMPSRKFWEIRIENVARTSQWIKICYENQKEVQSLVELPDETTAIRAIYGYQSH